MPMNVRAKKVTLVVTVSILLITVSHDPAKMEPIAQAS